MSDIIDINVGETIEEVTINVTDNLITVNINKVTGGGGGTQTLAQTLVLGNITDGENISISNGDAIILDNGSMLKKGTIDAGNGGSKGISQICGVGFEHKWEAGRLYIMNDGGTIIREVSHNLTYTPTATDDVTKGFVQNTRWILDNGDVYLCTDPTEDAAVWELVNTGTTPTLQQVTTEGNETTNAIKVIDTGSKATQLQATGIAFQDIDDGGTTVLAFEQTSAVDQQINIRGLSGTMALLSDIPAAQVNSDWNATSGVAEILNKPTIPSVTGFVPYTGATADLDLGTYNLTADHISLNVSPSGAGFVVGATEWNNTLGSSQTLLKGGNVILKNGVDLVARVVNKVVPNTTLTKAAYQVVKVSGASGQKLAVDLARANTDLNSADTLGIVTETIATNQEGFILTVGQIEDINTTGSLQGETWVDGDVLYLSPTTAGRMTNIKPTGATGHIVVLGYVEYAHANNGKIYVKIMNGWELDELHNVYISSVANNQGLVYESSTDLWKNKTIDKTFVGLGNVDNTSDANKPVSTAQQTAINAKVADSITDGVTTIAPSQNAVFDAYGGLAGRINQNYIISVAFSGTSPIDNTTYYIGPSSGILATTEANRRWQFPYATTIRTLSIALGQTAAGTSEAVSVYLRNSTAGTETLVGTFTSNFTAGTGAFFNFSGLNISIPNTTDNWTLKIVTPTWATNPTAWSGSFFLIAN